MHRTSVNLRGKDCEIGWHIDTDGGRDDRWWFVSDEDRIELGPLTRDEERQIDLAIYRKDVSI